jgi:hypothetical protein
MPGIIHKRYASKPEWFDLKNYRSAESFNFKGWYNFNKYCFILNWLYQENPDDAHELWASENGYFLRRVIEVDNYLPAQSAHSVSEIDANLAPLVATYTSIKDSLPQGGHYLNLMIDMRCPDEFIIMMVARLVEAKRREVPFPLKRPGPKPSFKTKIGENHFATWKLHRIAPLYDLLMWKQFTKPVINDEVLGGWLYPDIEDPDMRTERATRARQKLKQFTSLFYTFQLQLNAEMSLHDSAESWWKSQPYYTHAEGLGRTQ